ncbi:HEAT repeat containing 2 [Carabus blaptoides fortunei]
MSDSTNSDQENIVITFVKQFRNDLQSDELYRRKKTLQNINEKIFPEGVKYSQSVYHQTFADCHLQVLKCFRDSSETCRELAVQLMANFIKHLDLNDYYLTYIFPVLVERIGTAELVEQSEELRLELVNFLLLIVTTYAKNECLVPFLNVAVNILRQTVVDDYPKIKEASCKCVIELAAALPRHFHLQCDSLVKPVIQSFRHQHYRIRVIAIRAIGEIILHSSSSTNIMEMTVGPLAEKLFDSVPNVRQTIAEVAARLLTEYRDRYSHFHKLLPLILTGLCDEVPETKTRTEMLWVKVGQQYEKENESDLKDQLDFPVNAVAHYPKEVARPNLGCRVLVQRHVSKMVGAICNELSSWQDDIRVRCAQLLCSIVLHCEQFFTQSLQDVLPTMYTACADRDSRVYDNVMRAARLIGTFVPVSTWSPLVLPSLQDSPTYGHLRVLRCITTGCSPEDLATITVDIGDILVSEIVRSGSRKVEYQQELVECCRPLVSNRDVSTQMFEVLLCVASTDTTARTSAKQLLVGLQDTAHSVHVLLTRLLLSDAAIWTSVSADRCMFDALLVEWGAVLVLHLALLNDVLMCALDEHCEPEARLKTYEALSTFLQAHPLPHLQRPPPRRVFDTFVDRLIKEILLVALVWRAGRTAEALRTAATYCLSHALPRATKLPVIDESQFAQFLALLVTLIEDAATRTRLYAIHTLIDLGRLLKDNPPRHRQWTNTTAVTLLKRLDDPTSLIRVDALNSLITIAHGTHELDTQNIQYLVDTVLLHMDDEDNVIKEAALDVLKEVGRHDKAYLVEKLHNDKLLFKNGSACDELVQYLNKLSL